MLTCTDTTYMCKTGVGRADEHDLRWRKESEAMMKDTTYKQPG